MKTALVVDSEVVKNFPGPRSTSFLLLHMQKNKFLFLQDLISLYPLRKPRLGQRLKSQDPFPVLCIFTKLLLEQLDFMLLGPAVLLGVLH